MEHTVWLVTSVNNKQLGKGVPGYVQVMFIEGNEGIEGNIRVPNNQEDDAVQ